MADDTKAKTVNVNLTEIEVSDLKSFVDRAIETSTTLVHAQLTHQEAKRLLANYLWQLQFKRGDSK